MDYGYYIQYTDLKRISNKNTRTLLFLLRFTFGFDETTSIEVSKKVANGKPVDPGIIRDPRIFS